MPNLKEKKYAIALKFARVIGFMSLNDFGTVITQKHLHAGMPFIKTTGKEIISTFRSRRLRQRMKKSMRVNDVIKIFRTLCKDDAIRRGIYSKKVNVYVNGKKTSRYAYQLLG